MRDVGDELRAVAARFEQAASRPGAGAGAGAGRAPRGR